MGQTLGKAYLKVHDGHGEWNTGRSWVIKDQMANAMSNPACGRVSGQ